MKLSRLQSLPQYGISLDTETDLILPGVLAPDLVLGSASWIEDNQTQGVLLDRWQILEAFIESLEDPNTIIVGANLPFDISVVIKALEELGIDINSLVYSALEQERIYDLQTAEALNAVSDGVLGKDPRTGGALINPETGRRGRYSLSTCVDLNLNRQDAKVNDEFRLRYGEFKGVPLDLLPQQAREYPVDDTNNAFEASLAQTGHIKKYSSKHNWGRTGGCDDCGARSFGQLCHTHRPHRNTHDLANQVWTHFAMHRGAVRGFHVNQKSVDIIERHRTNNKEKDQKPFYELGILREDGSENRSELKRLVAVTYGAQGTCPTCKGTGKVPSRAAKPVRCTACKGRCVSWKAGGKVKEPTVKKCDTCKNTGLIPNPNPAMVNCHDVVVHPDGKEKVVKTCDGTGLMLGESVPRSEKEGISYGRDTLHESSDPNLMNYGDFQEDAKDLNVYIPYLRTARVCLDCVQPGSSADHHTEECIAKHVDKEYEYRDVPLTLRPNVILETGRTSYDGVVQLFPRRPGYVEAREEIIEVPDDYVLQPGEEIVK